MKIYSQLIDLSKTTPQTFYVPPHSKFKLGVKLVQDIDFSVKLDGAALASDGEVDGFKTFSLESTNPGNTIYIVEAANGQKVKILQTTTNSTVFDVDGVGVSQEYVVGKVQEEATARATADEQLRASIDNKADLSAVPTKTSELSNDSGFLTKSGTIDNALSAETANTANSANSANSVPWTGVQDKPIASVADLGLVKVGNNLTIDSDGTLNAVGGVPEGNFVKSVNSELPIDGNIDVTKLLFTTDEGQKSGIDGKTISDSLRSIEDQLHLKIELADIVPIAPATDAPEEALAGAKATADFVNSSIATNTANFAGTFTSESEFPAVATNNDYLFLDTVDSDGNKIFKRYKYAADTSRWVYEYTLNNSSFTAAQWAAIQSGITAGDVADMAKKSELDAHTVVLSGEFEDGTTFNYTVYTK